MERRWLAGSLAAAALAWASAAGGERMQPNPEARRIFDFESGAGRAWGMSAEPGGGGVHVGLELVCRTEEPAYAEAKAYFGGWPEGPGRVQLRVRSVDGRTVRFGRAVSGSPEWEFHIARVTDLRDLERFVKAALRQGALVSNGYRAFWNRASEARNAEVRGAMLDCVEALKRKRRSRDGQRD